MDYSTLRRSRRVSRDYVFEPGDHLFYMGAFGVKELSHHGVYVGNGQVAHFFPVTDAPAAAMPADAQTLEVLDHNKKNARIHLTPVEEFSKHAAARATSGVYVYNHAARDRLPRVETVRRCLTLLGHDKYNAVSYNCEHFVNYCVLGTKTSKQIESLLGGLVI